MKFKVPLTVYITWHPKYTAGQEVANCFYSALCRDVTKPLVRSIGIPVFFRNDPPPNAMQPIDIDFSESENTAILVLVSNEFLLDKNYRAYLEQLVAACRQDESNRRIFPVALASNAFNVSKDLTAVNFVRVDDPKSLSDPQQKSKTLNHIKTSIVHELCRMLLNLKKASEEKQAPTTLAPPVKLFISHSKHDDSKKQAESFRDFINSQLQLKTFFDANDIAFGSNFGDEIKKAANESAVVVFQSDSYSEREWCRIEVLTAKAAGCPVVVVNAVEKGEKRIFPYMGNYPSIRLNDNFEDIVGLTLEQVLNNRFSHLLMEALATLYDIKGNVTLSSSPGVIQFYPAKEKNLQKDDEFVLVIYPDPPLGTEEMDILNQLDDNFSFATPLLLPSITL